MRDSLQFTKPSSMFRSFHVNVIKVDVWMTRSFFGGRAHFTQLAVVIRLM